jgi:hypothetical protein
MENIEIKDFRFNPELRKLLIQYCLMMYEENAILDEENLIKEYNYLNDNNSLNELFLCEFQTIKSLQKYV